MNLVANYFHFRTLFSILQFTDVTMTKLSVNINKIATLRNARGGTIPNLIQVAIDLQRFGAEGITVHPRPDERHIRRKDVYELKPIVFTELNIEGYPSTDFLQLIKEIRPAQATLVPDSPNVLTSNAGWNSLEHKSFLSDCISEIHSYNVRASVFVDANVEMMIHTKETGTDRIELYTESYAKLYSSNKEKSIAPFILTANAATELGLGINAGHDLSLENLKYFASNIPNLLEVSIGHALISDALYYGLENTVQLYLRQLK